MIRVGDPLVDYAVALAQHLNDHHPSELRAGAARLAGLGEDEILAATVTDVTQRSARLRWIDPSGAHHRTLEFNAAATDPELLDYLLREQLAGY